MLPLNEEKLHTILARGSDRYEQFHPSAFDYYSYLMHKEGELEASRWRCQTDLFFLMLALGYTRIVDSDPEVYEQGIHRRMAEFFIRKDPRLPLYQQDTIRERWLFEPRGSYKTTFQIGDSVQFVLGFPEVRIFVMSAAGDLSAAVVEECRDHFIKEKDADPTLIQELFPGFVIAPRDKRTGEYTAPCRVRKWREPSIMALSISQSVSGWHCDVFKPEDSVDNRNSKTPPGRKTVIRDYYINKHTLMPGGYTDGSGTRYGQLELYNDVIKKAKPGKVKILVEPAYRVKPEAMDKPEEELTREDVELLFEKDAEGNPQLTWEFLMDEKSDDPESFANQRMNDPLGGKEQTFPKELLLAVTTQASLVPITGDAKIAWRFAYESKTGMQFTCGVMGLLNAGRLYIKDVVRGTFKPSSLATRIIQLAKKHGVHRINIEDTPGARYHESAIHNYGLVMNWPVIINWTEFQEDDAVRKMRIEQTEPLLTAKRLLFSDEISQSAFKELFDQFENFGAKEENEIPDVVSRVADALPKLVVAAEEQQDDDEWERLRRKDLHDRIYGLGRHAEQEPAPLVSKRPANPNGLEDILGGLNG